MLLDLATFDNLNQNAQMGFTGQHQINNLTTGKDSKTMFNDHKGGQFSTVANTVQNGEMQISGNHKFQNFTNNGNTQVMPRAFNPDGSPAQLMLMDLADFNNFSNMAGGNASFQGTHGIKNLNNAKDGNVAFLDHKGGQFSTVGNTNNAGNMNVSGLHKFDNTVNSGNFNAMARTFNPDGSPAAILMDLASFNQFSNMAGGNASFQGTHDIAKLNNAKDGNVRFLDHKGGQFSTVGETMNAGNMQVSGLHKFDKTTNSGNFQAMARTFNPDGSPAAILMDLAEFNNFANQAGGVASIQGTHAFKNLSNAKDGTVNVLDHKGGQFSTFGNTNNAGNMNVSGLHKFDNTVNSGNFNAMARTFNPDGSPATLLLL
jgi:intracellular sulfur oxidation DsrE/DsrF family protein